MTIAVISDIHSDIYSLEKIIEFLGKRCIHKIICLGDIIGYGDFPREVLDVIYAHNIQCLRGNHEDMLTEVDYEKHDTKYNLIETKKKVNEKDLEYLKNLPIVFKNLEKSAVFSHTVPFGTSNYFYPNSDYSVFDRIEQGKIFIGHSHYPQLISYYDKKIINPGAVSQPRDNLKKSSFLICDDSMECFEFIRI